MLAELKEKCPHYDPVTREQVKPGKSCPQYNTAKGCPYAHPWESTWDGDNTPYKGVALVRGGGAAGREGTPSSKRVARRGDSRSSNASESMAVAIIPPQARNKENEDAMEVDSPKSEDQELNIITNTEEEEYEASVPEPVLPGGVNPVEYDAVATFIRQLAVSLYHANAYEKYTDELRNYKAMYKATKDDGPKGSDIRALCTPSVHELWVNGKTDREHRSKERLQLMDGWIDGLIALDGEDDSRRMDEDLDMDGGEREQKRENPFVLALKDRRRRLQKGVVGQRLVDLLITLDESKRVLEEKQMQIGAQPEQPQIMPAPSSRQEDLEMRDVALPTSSPPPDESVGHRIRAIKDKIDELSQRVQEVEESTTKDDTTELVRRIVDRVSDDYFKRLQKGEQSNSDLISGLVELSEKVRNERTSCQALERLLGGVPVFDKAIESQLVVVENISKQLESNNQSLNTMIGQIESGQTGAPVLERSKLVEKTRVGILEEVLTNPAIFNGSLKLQPSTGSLGKHTVSSPVTLSYEVPDVDLSFGHSAIQLRQRQWLKQYEVLKSQALQAVTPVAERTKRQMERLEVEGKEGLVATDIKRENDIMIH